MAPPAGGEPTGRGSTSSLWAELGRTPWAKVRPPDARCRALPPGLAQGWGPGNHRPGKGDWDPNMYSVKRGLLSYALSGPSPRTCLPLEALPGA